MPLLSNFSAVLPELAAPRLGPQLAAAVEDLAASLREQAPYRTGDLRASIEPEQLGDLRWAIRLLTYGEYVSRGHRVAGWGTSRRPYRRYKTRGSTRPTWWIEATMAVWQQGLARRLAP